MNRLLFCTLLLTFVRPYVVCAQDGKLPVPPDSVQQKALALVKEIFGQEWAGAETDEQKRALASRLLNEAGESQDPADKYVVLRVARDIATNGGDGVTAYRAIDAMDRVFQVDPVKMKASVLFSLSRKARLPAEHESVSEKSVDLMDLAVAKDDYEAAEKLADMALDEARKARNSRLVTMVVDRQKELAQLAKAYAEVEEATKTLEDNATDANANLVVGKYLCLIKGDWDNGLPMLALGSDPILKALATKELAGAVEHGEQAGLGDRWWDLAEGETGRAREQVQAHAAGWYKRALPHLRGLEKTKVEKRLKEAPAVAAVVVHGPVTRYRPSATQPSRLPKLFSVDLGNRIRMEFVLIPAGEFTMGSSEEERRQALRQAAAHKVKGAIGAIPGEGPQHRVKISKPFYLGKYEVTQAQWQAVMGKNPSKFKAPMNPIEQVSWNDIRLFLAKLNAAFEENGVKFGLPTEAQWEYACRAGTTTAFYFGDDGLMLLEYGWFKRNSRGTHPVGQAKPNAWGLYDMHGNVSEWCADRWAVDYYAQSPSTDPIGPSTGLVRVFRGGGWYGDARHCRSAFRGRSKPDVRRGFFGFRVVAIPPGGPPSSSG